MSGLIIKSPLNVEISDGRCTKVVHTNRLQHRYVPGVHDMAVEGSTVGDDAGANTSDWVPPTVDHIILPPDATSATLQHYPERERQPADRH